MQATEKLFLQTVGRFVQERITPVLDRLKQLEAVDIPKLVRDAVQGERDGIDSNAGKGLSADDVRDIVRDEVARAVAAMPSSPSVVGGYIDLVGDLFFTNSSGGVFKVGHVVGKDADPAAIEAQIKAACEKYPPPKDGADGFSLTDFTLEFDGERTAVARFASGDIQKEFTLKFAVPLYRGVWQQGEYERGDMVTRDGSIFIALKDTMTVPGTPDSNWQLATKRGRDGKDKR